MNESTTSLDISSDQTEEGYFISRIRNNQYKDIHAFLEIENTNPKIWEYKTKEDDGTTVLHLSIFLNYNKIINEIITYCQKHLPVNDFKEFINQKNQKGITALHYASFKGNVKIIHKLIEIGADISLCTGKFLNVIHFACQGNKPNSLTYFKYFHEKEINLENKDSAESTPLHWACYSSAIEAVNYLLFWNVEINCQDKDGNTPLHLAILGGSIKIVRFLLQNGASTKIKNKKDETPLMMAKKKKRDNICELLVTSEKCTIINFKAPAKKTEKSRGYIYFSICFQLITAIILFGIIFPERINVYENKNNENYSGFLKGSYIFSLFSYVPLTLFLVVIYCILIFSESGKMKSIFINKNNFKKTLFNLLVEKNEDMKNFCIKCKVYTTKDSRHCTICNKCCEGFDHHCYWVNNCIGNDNYCFFMQFLFASFLNFLIMIIILSISLVVFILFSPSENIKCDTISWTEFEGFIEFPLCCNIFNLKFFDDNKFLFILISNILLLAINLFFIVPDTYLVTLHIKICRNKRRMNKINENKKRSTINIDNVNTDDLLEPDNSEGDISFEKSISKYV